MKQYYEANVSIPNNRSKIFKIETFVDLNQVANILKELVPKKGKSNAAVGARLGISGQLLGQYISGGRNPKADFYVKWKKEFGEDLLAMIEANVSRDTFSSVETNGSNNYLEKRRAAKNTNTEYLAPLVPAKAQAGYVKSYDQIEFLQTLERFALPPGIDYRGAAWRYFEIEGESMEPTFASGDIVLASMVPPLDWPEIRNFYIYVILTDTDLFIKRVFRKNPKTWVMISDNEKEYPQELMPVERIKELWVFRRHIDPKAPPPKKFEIKV